jgi:hypothetical protein
MSSVFRRKFITTALAVAAGATGIAVAAKVAQHHGLSPPDAAGLYGPGETLTYAAQRLLTRHSMAREFSHSEISQDPFANEVDPLGDEFKRLTGSQFHGLEGDCGRDGGAAGLVLVNQSVIHTRP